MKGWCLQMLRKNILGIITDLPTRLQKSCKNHSLAISVRFDHWDAQYISSVLLNTSEMNVHYEAMLKITHIITRQFFLSLELKLYLSNKIRSKASMLSES